MTPDDNDPAWEPVVRERVRHELATLLRTMRRLLASNADAYDTFWEPDEIQTGDISGVTNAARVHLIEPLEKQLAAARAVLTDAHDQAEEYKRALYGDAYQPPEAET